MSFRPWWRPCAEPPPACSPTIAKGECNQSETQPVSMNAGFFDAPILPPLQGPFPSLGSQRQGSTDRHDRQKPSPCRVRRGGSGYRRRDAARDARSRQPDRRGGPSDRDRRDPGRGWTGGAPCRTRSIGRSRPRPDSFSDTGAIRSSKGCGRSSVRSRRSRSRSGWRRSRHIGRAPRVFWSDFAP